MLNKICTAEEAAALVRDGDCLACSGNMNMCVAEEVCIALEKRWKKEQHPRDLTLMSGSGIGNIVEEVNYRGFEHFAHRGMVKRTIVGHNGANKRIMRMQQNNEIEAYNFPIGIIEQMYRSRSRGMDIVVSRVGIGTFVDPRLQGGKTNAAATEDLVSVVHIKGKEYLSFDVPRINIALIRGTTADEDGNLLMDEEVSNTDVLPVAMAAHASGGIVICQVKSIVRRGSLNAKHVYVPGIFIDKLVVTKDVERNHRMTQGDIVTRSLLGQYRSPHYLIKKLPLNKRKLIARRAAFELRMNVPINLGIGIPEYIGSVAHEEHIDEDLILTVETGPIGGSPTSFMSFGASVNPTSFLDCANMFNMYDSGSLYATFLGLAECDPQGSVNVSLFEDARGVEHRPGAGGFINLTQGAQNIIFCGTLTAGPSLKEEIRDGRLVILREGTEKKFVNKLRQITFNGPLAMQAAKNVLYVTDRGVFRLTPEGLLLTEIAPGVDLERDILAQMEFRPMIADDLKLMDPRLFRNELMGLDQIIPS